MSIDVASIIVRRLGPCRIALDLSGHVALAHELALMGCDIYGEPAGPAPDGTGPLVGFVEWPREGETRSLAEALRPHAHLDTLVLMSGGRHRAATEAMVFSAGWSRHPAGLANADYPQWTGQALPPLTFWRRLPEDARGGVLSRAGQAADAIIARFAFAAQKVRGGDDVLVDAADAVDGVRVLEAESRARRFRRVAGAGETPDGEDVVDIALRAIPDHSLDAIIAIEPATPEGWVARLDDYARVLKFDGRLVLCMREAEPGSDARPAGWPAFHEEMARRFITEQRFAQVPITADPGGPRTITQLGFEADISLEWMIVTALANPMAGAAHRDAFVHPAFSPSGSPVVADFGPAYDNPWLYRTMVQMGERVGDEAKLAQLASHVIGQSRADSADRGAAISVLGYRALEHRAGREVAALLAHVDAYMDATARGAAPHVARWRISLAFLAGRLSEMIGDRAAAIRWFHMAAHGEWRQFSPILATKVVGGAFYEARQHLADGDREAARACFRHGMNVAVEAASAAHAAQLGDMDRPLPFYMVELAEVIDMGSQCANALANIHLHERDPGLFWRQIDIRRFGLNSWLRDLQRENHRLSTQARRKAA